MAQTTYDGLPVSPEPPFGATIVVHRQGAGGPELLLLHRAALGSDFEGDWAWTPPAGARLPDESADDCARRELLEETGLAVAIRRTEHGSGDWLVYVAQVPADVQVVLDGEHDRFEWVSLAQALVRCRPVRVAADIDAALAGLT